MEPKVRYSLVGLFVVLLGAGAVIIFIWLTRGVERIQYTRYHAFMRESVAGLGEGASVKYLGVAVGRVSAIDIDPDNSEEVRLTLDIARGTPVKTDTAAMLRSQGLTGLAYVDLEGGSRDAPLLAAEPGRKYPVIPTKPSALHRIDQVLTALAGDLAALLRDARGVLNEKNRETLSRTLDDLSALAHTLGGRREDLDRGIASGAKAAETLSRVAGQIESRLPAVVQRLEKTAEALEGMAAGMTEAGRDVGRAGRGLEGMIGENRRSIERFSNRTLPEMGMLVTELRQLAASLQRLSGRLEREPSSLLLGSRPEPPGPGEGGERR